MFKIIYGNIPFGYMYSTGFSRDKLWDFGKPDIIIDSNIAQIEHTKTVQSASFLFTMVGLFIGAAACGYWFGWIGVPLGGYFGAKLFGSRTRQVFSVRLTDGRYFTAMADNDIYKRLLSRARLSIYTRINQHAAR